MVDIRNMPIEYTAGYILQCALCVCPVNIALVMGWLTHGMHSTHTASHEMITVEPLY